MCVCETVSHFWSSQKSGTAIGLYVSLSVCIYSISGCLSTDLCMHAEYLVVAFMLLSGIILEDIHGGGGSLKAKLI